MTIKGNVAADAVLACVQHHKKRGLRLKEIRLQATWWTMFEMYVKKLAPELDFDENGVQFKNTIIKKGHSFMRERMEYDVECLN